MPTTIHPFRWWRSVAHPEVPTDDAAEDPEPAGADGPCGNPGGSARAKKTWEFHRGRAGPGGFMMIFMGFEWVNQWLLMENLWLAMVNKGIRMG